MNRWISIDRVIRMEAGKGARALRNVPHTLSILDSHFPRYPVLPGVLILGSLGELAVLVLKESTGQSWRLAGAEQVRFRHFVQPGDQMELSVELKQLSKEEALFSGSVRVEEKLMTTARVVRLVPATEESGDR
jgi:3-hydroxyacyl-[acyl-carrier-protein] dehydratase